MSDWFWLACPNEEFLHAFMTPSATQSACDLVVSSAREPNEIRLRCLDCIFTIREFDHVEAERSGCDKAQVDALVAELEAELDQCGNLRVGSKTDTRPQPKPGTQPGTQPGKQAQAWNASPSLDTGKIKLVIKPPEGGTNKVTNNQAPGDLCWAISALIYYWDASSGSFMEPFKATFAEAVQEFKAQARVHRQRSTRKS